MISEKELRAIARARLRDAHALLQSKRFDGACYLSGYAVELTLKARICRTLKWPGVPESAQDFSGMQSVKTHDLKILLRFSGMEARVIAKHKEEWDVVWAWNPEIRYKANLSTTAEQAASMVNCVERFLEVL
jgi:HEPN domain-containing protein